MIFSHTSHYSVISMKFNLNYIDKHKNSASNKMKQNELKTNKDGKGRANELKN